MKLSIKKNWLDSAEFLTANPFIFIPFIISAALEGLALELVYFSARRPVSFILGPIIRKFFGEPFLHYPDHLLILPKLFFYAQIFIYITAGAALTALAVNIFSKVTAGLPVKYNAVIRTVLKRYFTYFVFGLMVVIFAALLKKADHYLLTKFFETASDFAPNAITRLSPYISSLSLFVLNIILQVFFFLMIPIMVMQKRPFFAALAKSVYMGLRNFRYLFILIFIPHLLYLPILLLHANISRLISLTCPEMMLYLSAAGIVITLFIDSFVVISLSFFLTHKDSLPGKP